MKNKIILSIILTTLAIAIVGYINNLQNAKDLYLNNYTSTYNLYQNKSVNEWTLKKNDLTKTKSRSKRLLNAKNIYRKNVSTVNPFSKSNVTINSTKDYNANASAMVFTNENVFNEKKKYEVSGSFNITPLVASAKTNNLESGYSSSSSYSNGTPFVNKWGKQAAPITTLDDGIIIDPGGDPDPTTQIPIGDGYYIILILIIIYSIFKLKITKKVDNYP